MQHEKCTNKTLKIMDGKINKTKELKMIGKLMKQWNWSYFACFECFWGRKLPCKQKLNLSWVVYIYKQNIYVCKYVIFSSDGIDRFLRMWFVRFGVWSLGFDWKNHKKKVNNAIKKKLCDLLSKCQSMKSSLWIIFFLSFIYINKWFFFLVLTWWMKHNWFIWFIVANYGFHDVCCILTFAE